MDVEFICLANSKKHSGRCVAGIRTDGSGWIRPVSDSEDGSLATHEYLLDDGQEAALLDIVVAKVVRPDSRPHQPENWLMDGPGWSKSRTLGPGEASRALEPYLTQGPELLGSREDSVEYSAFDSGQAAASLAVIRPDFVHWRINVREGRRRTRVRFTLGGQLYDLSVTDPLWEERLGRLPEGTHSPRDAGIPPGQRPWLTVSLGEPFNGRCYKLAAAVLLLP